MSFFLTQRILKFFFPLRYLSRLMQFSLYYLRMYVRRRSSADLKIVKFYELTTRVRAFVIKKDDVQSSV